MTKVQPPVAPGGMFTKDVFDIDLQAQTVTCPNGITVPIRPVRGDKKLNGKAEFVDDRQRRPRSTSASDQDGRRFVARRNLRE
jgi:hypothetical protein